MGSLNSNFTLTLSIIVLLVSGCSGSATDEVISVNEPGVPESEGATLIVNDDADNGADNSEVNDTDNGSDLGGQEQGTLTNMPETGGYIGPDNYLAILQTAVMAMNVVSLDEDAEKVHQLARDLRTARLSNKLGDYGLTFISEEPFTSDSQEDEDFRAGINQHYSCDAGGSAVLPIYDADYGYKVGFSFDACFVGEDQYNGSYRSNPFRRHGGTGSTVFDNFSANFVDGSSLSIDGFYSSYYTSGSLYAMQAWEDTNYKKIDNSGFEFKQLGLNKLVTVNQSFDFDGESGYVTLSDGHVGLASPYLNNAGLESEFTISVNNLEPGLFKVSSDLYFDGDYLRWNSLNPEGLENFIQPDFPVSDLGDPLAVDRRGTYGGDTLLLRSIPEVPDGSEQWNTGSFSVIAEDGSRVVMRPSVDSIEMVDIQLNDSSDVITELWSNALQVYCTSRVEGCKPPENE